MSKVIVVIGKKKTGKTTWTKETLTMFPKSQIFIFDPNGHYDGCDSSGNIDKFLSRTANVTDSIIVIEEATIYFKSSKKQEELLSLMVRSRHQRNNLIVVFHSFRSLPTWIMDVTDCMKIFRTNDTRGTIARKFDGLPKVEKYFVEVNFLNKNPYESRFIDFGATS